MIDRAEALLRSLWQAICCIRVTTMGKGVSHAGIHYCRSTLHQLDVCIVFLHLVRHHGYRLCGIRFYAAFPAWVPIA
jgi:hypothetical protein